jgi:hypothetical protein
VREFSSASPCRAIAQPCAQALAWCAAILIVFFAAAFRLSRNTTG